jgi:hypothetical protein
MQHASGDLASYYAALSLPKDIVGSYETMINKWLKCNGTEWTVEHCKVIYVDFIRFRAGLAPVGNWYKKNSDNLPSGIYSRIFKLSLCKRHRFSCSTLLRSYTRFLSTQATEKQLSKWVEGVTSPDIPLPKGLSDGMCSLMCEVYGVVMSAIVQPSYLSYSPSPGKTVPDVWGRSKPEESHWSTQWETLEQTKTGRFLTEKYSNIFQKVFQNFERTRSWYGSFPVSPTIDSVGKIGLIQEPGYKLRAVANPNRVYQVALKPLNDIVSSYLEKLPWDCTFNQSKAFPVIQSHIRSGFKAHCIDLTGATDYFPLSLQLDLLNSLFPMHREHISLFGDIARSPWFFQDTTIVWTKGQPLGLLPSFKSFALTHGSLLFFLNGGEHCNKFFILGDDVVILDDELAVKYLNILKLLRCPVSLNKTISSKLVAEFGGKLIFSDFIEPQLKWRQLSDDNFVDIMKLLGANALRLLRPMQRKVAKAIWTIPEFCGGLGFNPDGIPLEVRYELYLHLFGDDEKGTFLMSYDRKFNKFFNEQVISPSNVTLSNVWNGAKLPDLDQRSAALCLKYLPDFLGMYGIMGTNLYSVVLNKDMLPIDGVTKSRSTLLAQLQRKLSI